MIKQKLKNTLLIILTIFILLSFIGQVGASGVTVTGGTINKEYFRQLFNLYYTDTTGVSTDPSDEKLESLVSSYEEIEKDSGNSSLDIQEKVKMAIKQDNPNIADSAVENIMRFHAEAQKRINTGNTDHPVINDNDLTPDYTGNNGSSDDSGQSLGDAILSGLGTIVDGLAGILFMFIKIIPLTIGKAITMVLNFILVGTEGAIDGMTIDKILFNEVPILQINFFEQVDSGTWNSGTINTIRTNIAIWYTSFRNLAAVALAIIVLYVGIRMAISTVADEKAKYKKMLVDWLVSLALLFVLHYIIVFVIQLNNTIVDVISIARRGSGENTYNLINEFGTQALKSVAFIKSFTYTFTYFMFCIMTLIFVITYVKRMITIAFLIMISPIITITYSIDRMGDGKSQALNKWFKEFVYNILLQPFQCIIYLALVETSLASMTDADLGTALICILMIVFIYQAEKIIKEIFHFESKSVADTIGQAAIVTTAMGLIASKKSGSQDGSKSSKRRKAPATREGVSDTEGPSGPGVSGRSRRNAGEDQEDSRRSARNEDTGRDYGNEGDYDSEPGGIKEKAGQIWNSKPARVARGIIGGAAKAELKLTGRMMFGAAGAATGNLSATLSGLKQDPIGNIMQDQERKGKQRKLAKMYNSEVGDNGIYGNSDNSWIRQHSKDLLNGDVEAQGHETDYYNQLLESKDYYMDQGLSEEKAIANVEQDIAKIQGGYIGERTMGQRFTGNLSNIIRNRRNND